MYTRVKQAGLPVTGMAQWRNHERSFRNMVEILKKNQTALSFISGIVLALSAWFFNPFGLDDLACKAVAAAILMITWWVTEALPMPVVALVPLLLHPLAGISTMDEVAKSYSNTVIFLFMGGFMIGLAIEKWNLHKRIALQIVRLTGTSGDRIILGFILATGFLSMWLSNTATTMMMFPIAISVITVMKEHEKPGPGLTNFSLVLMLVIAYASNIGGMATVIGTPPNVAFVGYHRIFQLDDFMHTGCHGIAGCPLPYTYEMVVPEPHSPQQRGKQFYPFRIEQPWKNERGRKEGPAGFFSNRASVDYQRAHQQAEPGET
jgi:di/tricarboxylate transporter